MKVRSLALLLLAEVAPMWLWFVSAAVLPDMLHEAALSPFRQAALSSGVQAGFVIGALGPSLPPRIISPAAAAAAEAARTVTGQSAPPISAAEQSRQWPIASAAQQFGLFRSEADIRGPGSLV